MIELIITNVLVLAGIGFFSALILYFVSKKFFVEEDPRISDVEALLPGINCGACGKAGCKDFATACVKSDAVKFLDLYCTVGGPDTMARVADYLGFKASEKEKTVAVLRCQGTCQNAPDKVAYTGLESCRLANRVSIGKSGCPNGCLRFGDCAKVCKFDALHIDPKTGIPVVDEAKCTSCEACVNICPRGLFEIRPVGPNGKRVYVACRNQQKGAIARKNCSAACIGCMKCTKVSELIKVENNLSYIPIEVDAEVHGEELAKLCPTKAIVYTGAQNEK